jgi:hypothetical protein
MTLISAGDELCEVGSTTILRPSGFAVDVSDSWIPGGDLRFKGSLKDCSERRINLVEEREKERQYHFV